MKPEHIIHFLGKRIAVQDGPNRYKMLILYGILSNGLAIVGTSTGVLSLVDCADLANSYIVIDRSDVEVEYL